MLLVDSVYNFSEHCKRTVLNDDIFVCIRYILSLSYGRPSVQYTRPFQSALV